MHRVVYLSEQERGHNDKSPALTVTRDGTLWVAWQSYRPTGDRILARAVRDDRAGTLLVVGVEAAINFQPTLAADGAGRVWVAWSGLHDGRWGVLARPIADGQPGQVVRLSAGDAPAFAPVAAADGAGRVWVAWVSFCDGQHRLFGRFLTDGEWSVVMPLAPVPGEQFRPALCADAGGAWVAWENLADAKYDIYLCRWTTDGPDAPLCLSLTDSWEMHPTLCPDGQGGVWAAWIASHDVRDGRDVIDHKVEIMAAHFAQGRLSPYRGTQHTKPDGYVTHLYDGLLGREQYWGFVGHRRRPQLVREEGGDLWVLYERKEDERRNRRGPDALFYGKPLTGRGRNRTFEVDTSFYAYTVNGNVPVVGGRLYFAGRVPAGERYGDVCAGTITLGRDRPVRVLPPSLWRGWRRVSLPLSPLPGERPQIRVDGRTYYLYWGDTHCHGACSGDAEGEIDENYNYGRYKSRLDFMAVTDNDFIYDDTLTSSEWALIRAEAGHSCVPGEFVTFSGYERSYVENDPPGPHDPNHRIILYADDEQPIFRYTEPGSDTLGGFVAQVSQTNAFVYPHHPYWWLMPNPRLGGVEVCSSWGVYIHQADTIPRALRDGYRLAFIGSSDTHRIVPGLGGALTGVWATGLTREAIWEALWARRCFATNGERLVLDVRVNERPMGAELSVAPGGVVRVRCMARAPRPIRCVDLFFDGEQVERREVDAERVEVVFEHRPPRGDHFYYLRLRLARRPRAPFRSPRRGNLQAARGEYAWCSPVWVQVP